MRFFYGPIINPESLTNYSIWPRALLAVGSNGRIAWLETDCAREDVSAIIHAQAPETVIDGKVENLTVIGDNEFLIPGFVDTHTVSDPLSDAETLRHLHAA